MATVFGIHRDVPNSVVPPHLAGQRCVLVSRVLPMGYLNSVSIAQHIHRNIVRWSAEGMEPPVGGEGELRKDKGMSSTASLYRSSGEMGQANGRSHSRYTLRTGVEIEAGLCLNGAAKTPEEVC